jgi:hypothetical protein
VVVDYSFVAFTWSVSVAWVFDSSLSGVVSSLESSLF